MCPPFFDCNITNWLWYISPILIIGVGMIWVHLENRRKP